MSASTLSHANILAMRGEAEKLMAQRNELLMEHQEWAASFGEALVLALQGDYSKVDELAKCLPIKFTSGAPVLASAAIEKATGSAA